MHVLEAALQPAFEARLAARVRELFAEEAAAVGDDAALGARIRAAIARAARYDVTRERDVALFVDLDIALGADFEDAPATAWARPMLESRYPGHVKIARVAARMRRQLAAEA